MTDRTVYKYKTKSSARFRKHIKLAEKRLKGSSAKVLEAVEILARGETLPERYCDHALTGNWAGHRECHILPDLLLIYRIYENVLILELVDTGSHSDLFSK